MPPIRRIEVGDDLIPTMREFDFCGRELGGCFFGRVIEGRVVRVIIERAIQNPGGPQDRSATTIEADKLIRLERYPTASDPDDDLAIIGDWHSHPTVHDGPATPSDADLESWRWHALAPGQPAGLYVGAIAYSKHEVYAAGESTGLADWRHLRLDFWITDADGVCTRAGSIR
jgi:hypothetical protein